MFSSLKKLLVLVKNHKKLLFFFSISIASIVSMKLFNFNLDKITIFDKIFIGKTIIYNNSNSENDTINEQDTRETAVKVKNDNEPPGKVTSAVKDPPKNVSKTLELDEEAVNTLSNRDGNDIYRFHLSEPGRLTLRWQAGERTSSKELYDVSLHRGNIEDKIVTYTMTSGTSYITSEPVFLTSGDYSVVIKAKSGIAVTYHMILQSEPMESIELEDNDNFLSATPIENDKAYSGALQHDLDQDYYKFQLTEARAVNVTLGTAGNETDTAAYILGVYNENRGILTEAQAMGNASFSETGNLYLRAGTYYVRIKKGNTWSGEAYTLAVRTSERDVMEAESNDTLETANNIPVNKESLASIGWEGDIDYFNFTLDRKAIVRPYLEFKRLGTALKIYSLTLGDVHGKEIAAFDFRGTGEPSKVIEPIKLEAGTYAIRLTRIKRDGMPSILHEYTLRISAQPTK